MEVTDITLTSSQLMSGTERPKQGDVIDHMRLTQYVHIGAFQDMGLILMTSGISINGHKAQIWA